MIQLSNIKKTYITGDIKTFALQSVNLTVNKGDFVVIAGLSGSGKSTLLHIIGTLDKPDSGSYLFNGQDMYACTSNQLAVIRNRNMGFIFQSFNLIPQLSVYENIELPLIYRGTSATNRKEKVTNLLKRVGLQNRKRHFPGQLSGGQQQRVAIARALVGDPCLIIGDEPTGNLDSSIGKEIINLLKEINSELKTTIVIVTHDKENFKSGNVFLNMIDGHLDSGNRNENE